jgi:hypothetical protein
MLSAILQQQVLEFVKISVFGIHSGEGIRSAGDGRRLGLGVLLPIFKELGWELCGV